MPGFKFRRDLGFECVKLGVVDPCRHDKVPGSILPLVGLNLVMGQTAFDKDLQGILFQAETVFRADIDRYFLTAVCPSAWS